MTIGENNGKETNGQKAAITALIGLIACAILLGALLLNKGDGPVTGMILSGAPVADAEAYADAQNSAGTASFWSYPMRSQLPNGLSIRHSGRKRALCIRVLCGMPGRLRVYAKILYDGTAAFEQEGTLETDPYGVICYPLDGETLPAGDYVFALYDGEEQIFSQPFTLE